MLTLVLTAGILFAEEGDGRLLAIRAGKVFTADLESTVLHHGVVLVRGRTIEAVGRAQDVVVPEGCPWIEAPDAWLVPGFIDCHNHIAGSLNDLNDGVYGTNPGLRTVDIVAPESANILNAREDGVSSVLLIPGSGNNMSGFGTLVKLAGATPEDMILASPGSLKIAQGDNPKRYWYGQERSYMNWSIRSTLQRALEYHQRWSKFEESGGEPPQFDPTWDDFRGLFQRKYPASVHTQRFQLVMKSILQIHDEFGIWLMLDHSTMDGFLAAPLAVERDLEVIVGPRQLHFESSTRKIHGCAAEWWERGVSKIGLNTDAPVVAAHDLRLQASMAVHFGLPQEAALIGLTRIPALALGLSTRCGSIAPGFDADLALWSGDPLDMQSRCELLLVEGEVAHDSGVHTLPDRTDAAR